MSQEEKNLRIPNCVETIKHPEVKQYHEGMNLRLNRPFFWAKLTQQMQFLLRSSCREGK